MREFHAFMQIHIVKAKHSPRAVVRDLRVMMT